MRKIPQGIVLTAVETRDRKKAQDACDENKRKVNIASIVINESVADTILQSFPGLLSDPIALWATLEKNFARTSQSGRSSARRELLSFEHRENETADETIDRFDRLVSVCEHEKVPITIEDKDESILSRPNDRYKLIKHINNMTQDSQTVDQI